MSFPKDFTWGAAAASYQIEGAAFEDGKGPSVWDAFAHRAGTVWEGGTGDVACDHYHRFREDVALWKSLGLRAYRLSLSWARVLPDGTGRVNDRGLAFYDQLVDALLAAGITPWVTVFHWDYPNELFKQGGWLNRRSPEWFAEYAGVVVDRLGDRVTRWFTLNEPQVFIGFGQGTGLHAPGVRHTLAEQLLSTHHALMAHGRAVQVIRARAKAKPMVGWAPVGVVKYPATGAAHDVAAARSAMFACDARDTWNNTWYSDPVCLGRYPEDGLRAFGADVPAFADADLRVIQQPLDFYGMNVYHGDPVRQGDDGKPTPAKRPVGHPVTAFHWPVEPESLYWGPRFIAERYKLPVVITENGLSSHDWVALDGKVHDPARIDFTARYLGALKRAARDGVDVRGYFHWSIMDNFEWAEGYKHRFGLIHVDFATQKRTPKDSAHWYRGVIESNGATL